MPSVAGTELLRKGVHIAAGFLALTLRWLDPLVLAPVALAGVIFNVLVLPRLDGWLLWRPAERSSGSAVGVVTYPVTVLALIVLFRNHREAVAAGWAVLAFGDGAASIAGQLWGGRRLPWNPDKSWAGFLAFWSMGSLAVAGLVSWISPGLYDTRFLLGCAVATGLVAALLESSNQRLDDNLAVPLVSALFFLCLQQSLGGWDQVLRTDFLFGLAFAGGANLVFAAFGLWLGGLSPSGAVAAWLIGTTILGFLGIRGYMCLLMFFLVGTSVTRLGRAHKKEMDIAEDLGGRRRAANALANGGVAALCALFAIVTQVNEVFILAFVTSLAAACADTVESEIGQVWGRPTLLITTFRPVEPGTNGGISAVGTLAGFSAAALIVAQGAISGFYGWSLVLPLSILALTATMLESVVGATLERRGLLDNQGVNFFNTLLAALLGASVGRVLF